MLHKNHDTTAASGFWDKTGAALSWACAVHCLAMPFLISLLPAAGFAFFAHEGIEYLFIGSSVLVASISLLPGFFRFHRNVNTLLLFAGGIALMISADGFFEENFAGKILTVAAGALFVTAAHALNRYLCRKCENCGKIACRSSAQ
jgi:4-hydroxybenzoate polyprenyltransferase